MEIKLHYIFILQENNFILCNLSTGVIARCHSKVNELQEYKAAPEKT